LFWFGEGSSILSGKRKEMCCDGYATVAWFGARSRYWGETERERERAVVM